MQIEMIDIAKLVFDPNNARKHAEKNLKSIKGSLTKFGQQKPIVVNRKNIIIAGNGTVAAAKDMGWKQVAAVYTELDDFNQAAFALADNRTSELAEWDAEILKESLASLDLGGFDLESIGFDAGDFDFLEPESKEGLTDPDQVPEVPQNAHGVQLGDIWQLGRHRLMCGDSTSKENVEKLMDGKKADMVFTSPPYNADTKAGEGDIFNGKKSKKLYADGYSDNLESADYVNFAKTVLQMCFDFTNGFIFWNVSYNKKSRFEYIAQIVDHLPYLIEQICWKKTSTIPFKGSLMRDWEPIYLFSTSGKTLGLDTVTSNHWQVSNTDAQQKDHKACFPVALPQKAIELIKPNLVMEPFLGSGSTLIACEKTNRKCYGMELDPHYCSVIIQRWQDYTGQLAERITDGPSD